MTRNQLNKYLETIKNVLICVLLLIAIITSLHTQQTANSIASYAYTLKNIVQPVAENIEEQDLEAQE